MSKKRDLSFVKMGRTSALLLILFIVSSIISFLPPVTNTILFGISFYTWYLTVLCLALPSLYLVLTIKDEKTGRNKGNN